MGTEVEDGIHMAGPGDVHVVFGVFVLGGLDGVCVFTTDSRRVGHNCKRKLPYVPISCLILETY